MVDLHRVKRKLPSLLTSEATTSGKGWRERQKISYRLQQLQRCDPERYHILTVRLNAILKELEMAINT